jgi:uncharacterized protein (DUF736 family)
MAITLGTFTKLDDGAFTGTLKTLNVTANLTIIPVDKQSDNAPLRIIRGGAFRLGPSMPFAGGRKRGGPVFERPRSRL